MRNRPYNELLILIQTHANLIGHVETFLSNNIVSYNKVKIIVNISEV